MKIKNQTLGLCLVAVFVLLTGCGITTESTTESTTDKGSVTLSESEIEVLSNLDSSTDKLIKL